MREEVAAFGERQAERRFLQVLTEQRASASARRTAGSSPAARAPGPRADADVAVAVALQAFEDGLYLVLLDGGQQRKLDAQVNVGEETTLTFLRLVALAGG